MKETNQTTIPPQLYRRATALVKEGWFADVDAVVAEALRRYLESHQVTLSDSFLREDVEWGLRGND